MPLRAQIPQSFLSIDGRNPDDEDDEAIEKPLTGPQLIERLRKTARGSIPMWILLKPLFKSNFTQAQRGSDLVKRMVSTKTGGAEAIFATNIFDEEHGLMQPLGAPTLLFLPWRSTALALQGAEFIGSFSMLGGSENYAFARDDEVVLFIWNDEPVAENIYLGEKSKVIVMDIWGRQKGLPFDEQTKLHIIEAGPVPQIIRRCNEAVTRWRLASQLEKGNIPSATGRHSNAIVGLNTFSQGVSVEAKLNMPPEWEADPTSWEIPLGKGEQFSLPMVLTIPANTSLGSDVLSIDFIIDAAEQHNFRVYRPVKVGLGDVFVQVFDRKLEDGRLEIEQVIVNRTNPEKVLNFFCNLFVPGYRRQKKFVIKLGNGKNQKKYYIPNAEKLRGKELWLRAEQIEERRVLNKRWIVGQKWDEQDKEQKAARLKQPSP